jgi:hypothetical protein
MKVQAISLALILLIACKDDTKKDEPVSIIPIKDVTPPVVTLLGQPMIFHELGVEYVDIGVRGMDESDGVVDVQMTGSVDVNIEGTYQLQFEAKDIAENIATVTREVVVVAPGIEGFINNKIIQQNFPASYIRSVETMIRAHDDVILGDYLAARERIDAVFATQPLSAEIWTDGELTKGLNTGHPVGYYALRMLDDITNLGEIETNNNLQLTAVIAMCANVERLTWPELATEKIDLTIDPAILSDGYKILYESTDLFRRWVKAITRGTELNLVVHESNQCTRVDAYQENNLVISYPNAEQMVSSVPDYIAAQTDMWWVIAPSGVPGDGSGFNLHFITGGMGLIEDRPLFLSDDAWFTRKPEHLGSGKYLEIERRSYLPQWFQHEFMHHLFQAWPEFGLEKSDHQWFDRSLWPNDFKGKWEPDYYAEAIEKRFITASPSLSNGLDK